MTAKQQNILTLIRDYIAIHKYAPSIRDLTAAAGLRSVSTMHGHLTNLKRQGIIQWEPDRPRTLKVLHE